MTKKQAIEVMKEFYRVAEFRIIKRSRNLYTDHVLSTFQDKCDAIITACIITNKSNKVWSEVQEMKFKMEDALIKTYEALEK